MVGALSIVWPSMGEFISLELDPDSVCTRQNNQRIRSRMTVFNINCFAESLSAAVSDNMH